MSTDRPLIMLVEDDQATLLATAALLRLWGCQVRTYESAEALLDQPELPEQGLVVADLRLPRLSGLQLFRELQQRGCRLPFVLISGHAEERTIEKAFEEGVAKFLLKPIDPTRFVQELQELQPWTRPANLTPLKTHDPPSNANHSKVAPNIAPSVSPSVSPSGNSRRSDPASQIPEPHTGRVASVERMIAEPKSTYCDDLRPERRI